MAREKPGALLLSCLVMMLRHRGGTEEGKEEEAGVNARQLGVNYMNQALHEIQRQLEAAPPPPAPPLHHRLLEGEDDGDASIEESGSEDWDTLSNGGVLAAAVEDIEWQRDAEARRNAEEAEASGSNPPPVNFTHGVGNPYVV